MWMTWLGNEKTYKLRLSDWQRFSKQRSTPWLKKKLRTFLRKRWRRIFSKEQRLSDWQRHSYKSTKWCRRGRASLKKKLVLSKNKQLKLQRNLNIARKKVIFTNWVQRNWQQVLKSVQLTVIRKYDVRFLIYLLQWLLIKNLEDWFNNYLQN